MIRVADYIIQRISAEGAKHIFLVTGRGMLYLSDAVAKNQNVTGISVHHEQSASYAAMAYAESNNTIGACLVSTGCASTNAITGVLCAWQDNIPVVFISGQNMLHETSRFTKIPLRTFGQQEADIVSIVKPITKYAVMLDNPQNVGFELDKALYLATSGRKGPVWIDVPLDIQDARIDEENLVHYTPIESTIIANEVDIQYVVEALNTAKRPVILIGSGIRASGADSVFRKFVDKLSIPVTYSTSAVDTYNTNHRLSIGTVSSMGGTRAGNFAVQNSDLLLVLGNRLSPMTTSGEFSKFARDAKIIVVDIDAIEHSKNTVRIDKLILSDVKMFLQALIQKDINPVSEEWVNKCIHWKDIFPKCEDQFKSLGVVDIYQLTDSLSKTLQDETTLITDAGLEEVIIPANITLKDNQHCVHPTSQGSMGFALPALIGSYFATQNPIVAVIGDGSVMMNLQELETISYQQIPAKIFVINNNGYSIIRRRQHTFFRNRTIGNDPGDGVGLPSFSKIAECFGLNYILINDSKNITQKISSVLATDGPVLCEVLGPENQNYIHSAYARNSQKHIVNRPLEDQAPFLDREIFLSEMVITPIDQ